MEGVSVLGAGLFGLSFCLGNCVAVGLGLGGIVDTFGIPGAKGSFLVVGIEAPSNPVLIGSATGFAVAGGGVVGFVGEGGLTMEEDDPCFSIFATCDFADGGRLYSATLTAAITVGVMGMGF